MARAAKAELPYEPLSASGVEVVGPGEASNASPPKYALQAADGGWALRTL